MARIAALHTFLTYCTVLLCLAAPSLGQGTNCPNQLFINNQNIRSACINGTFFIVPIDQASVATAVKPYNLLPLPTSDKSLFPNGFPKGKFPVLVTSTLQSDVRMSDLQLPKNLLGGSLQIPYVDRLSDGKTPFLFSIKQFVGGFDGADISASVPALVGSLGGTTLFIAQFVPNTAPYELISGSNPEFITQIKQIVVPNPVSGPGVILEVADADFFTSTTPQFPAHTFHDFISQPLILTNTLCQRNPIFFNFTFTDEVYRQGSMTLVQPGAGPFQGVYQGVQGYSASGNQLGYNAESCENAAAMVDPVAVA